MPKQHYHFIGICGTAMGSVAAAMKARGFTVTGSDQNVYPPMSTFLEESGVEIFKGYRREHIPAGAEVIVIGNAISRGNEEAEEVLDRKLLYLSLPEVLKEQFLRGRRNFVVTGTHGKTTTSAILAWLFESAGRDPSFMIGGLPRNLGRGARLGDSEFVVLEGDEYDTAFFDKRSKFLHYLPEVVTVNNIEFDHADIYDSLDEIKLTFRRLLNIVPRSGLALVNGDDSNCLEVADGAPCPVRTIGLGEACNLRIGDIDYQPDGSSFTLEGERYTIPMVGEFNVRNAAMAVTAGRFGGLAPGELRTGLAAFSGIARRQELRGEVRGVKVIDDFAHHPTAIHQAAAALRQRYPGQRLWVIFEPRSNTTRRSIFQEELAEALAAADIAIVPAIADAEKFDPQDRLDPEKLVADVAARGGAAHFLPTVEAIAAHVAAHAEAGDVVAILSNGGFGGLHDLLLDQLGAGAPA
ncbi:MAG: UDP-N-acetylmuramate:L-alanyl-gamma-D-glutamyl-meso-diaminopimelate ligase [Akkermansiaceae bacterium]|nr:UDP-N-acetylmuramate:L-alanyl-gamma-D-glutamyl-meso-diaminopimelate ligase [Akkermansiaceae bacterium]NNM29704.1 UDP-N-acetylmuramate:L-alanyl-gamma-D-glutamyl-meso-diaminopimelate ligase [Akkermansiaceae bacterium]